MPPPAKLSSAGIFQKQSQAPVVCTNKHTRDWGNATENNTTYDIEKSRFVDDTAKNYIMITSKIPGYYTSVHTHYTHIMHWI